MMQGFGNCRRFSRLRFISLPVIALLCGSVTLADTAADALKAVADAAAALANDDARTFLDQFDERMPDYAALRNEIEALLGASEVGSTVDVITNEGDDQKRALELDWVLVIGPKNSSTAGEKETRRGVVKCTVEHTGKTWKITALSPIDFFKH